MTVPFVLGAIIVTALAYTYTHFGMATVLVLSVLIATVFHLMTPKRNR